MLAWRTTWQVKQGKMEEATEYLINWVKAENKRNKVKGGDGVRIYTPDLSPYLLVYEENWEKLADHDAFWAEMNQNPTTPASWAGWNSLVERQLGNERWIVTELK